MKTVLITGGAGYIGSHATAVMVEAGFRVVVFDNLQNSKRSVIAALEKITGVRIPFYLGDVRDASALERVFDAHDIDVVMHFAGLKTVGESVEQPLLYYDHNAKGIITLLNVMHARAVFSLVFSSSAAVYGDAEYLPIDERHRRCPRSPYGRTKFYCEEILADLAESNPAWRVMCLRYFNPVGAHSSGLLGDNPTVKPDNLMPLVVGVASGSISKLKVYGVNYDTEDGTGIRDYIHVLDLAYGHLAALNYLSNNPGFNAINLGTGVGYSVLEVVDVFERISGRSIPIQVAPRRPGDTPESYADVKMAKKILDWQATLTLEDMCLSAWNFQQNKTP